MIYTNLGIELFHGLIHQATHHHHHHHHHLHLHPLSSSSSSVIIHYHSHFPSLSLHHHPPISPTALSCISSPFPGRKDVGGEDGVRIHLSLRKANRKDQLPSLKIIVTIVSKLGYNLLIGRIQPTFIGVISCNPFTKYHGDPSMGQRKVQLPSLKLTFLAPENGCLEDSFPFGGANC